MTIAHINKITGAVVLLIGTFLTPSVSHASIVDTFSFSQSGYAAGATLAGSFTGTVESSGYIEEDDLSSFNATLSGQSSEDFFSLEDVLSFSFLATATGVTSDLDFYVHTFELPEWV